VRRALRASGLPAGEREHALQASTHWLRHTYATQAAEREVPPDILQENLGQADPRTTARYYRAQLERRQRAVERAFSEGGP
jgi:integrase